MCSKVGRFCKCSVHHHTSMQSWARDNTVATTIPCFQVRALFVIAILLYLVCMVTPSRHLDLNTFWIFSGPWGSITLSRCHIVVVVKLYNCRVASYVSMYCTLGRGIFFFFLIFKIRDIGYTEIWKDRLVLKTSTYLNDKMYLQNKVNKKHKLLAIYCNGSF